MTGITQRWSVEITNGRGHLIRRQYFDDPDAARTAYEEAAQRHGKSRVKLYKVSEDIELIDPLPEAQNYWPGWL